MHTFITRDRFTYAAKVILLGLILGLGIQFAWSWTVPTEAPPGGNVSAPISTSETYQWKEGGLTLNTGWINELGVFTFGQYGLIIPYGKVGIGTVSPTYDFEIVGAAKADGFCLGDQCISKWPESVINPGTTPPEGYTEMPVNVGEDSYGQAKTTLGSTDTCDGVTGPYMCPPSIAKNNCVDLLEVNYPVCDGDNFCPGPTYVARNVTCSVYTGLVKTVKPNIANFTCGAWADCTSPAFDVCAYLGKNPNTNETFSLTTRQKGTAWSVNPAVGSDGWYTITNQFTLGTPKTTAAVPLSDGSKRHWLIQSYDGSCFVTGRVYYYGDGTSQSIFNTLQFVSVN